MERLRSIARRLSAVKLPLKRACLQSGASYTSVRRWLSDPNANPGVRNIREAEEKLERAAAEEEARLRKILAEAPPGQQEAA